MKKSILFAGLIACVSLTACGGGKDNTDSPDKTDKKEVQKMEIGVLSSGEPWGYIDEKGELVGYEIDVLKAVDERLEDYEFNIQGSTFQNILTGLDAGKFDLGTHMFEYNEERGQKYLYGEEGHIDYSTYFLLPVDSTYTTWESLAGKVVGTPDEKNNYALIMEKYNKENPDKAVIIDYFGDGLTDEAWAQSLYEGRWDATTQVSWAAEQWNNEFYDGKEVFKRGDQIGSSLAYYLYPKDGAHEEFKEAVDEVMADLKEEGVLKEISMKHFGFDVTPKTTDK